MVLLSVPSMEEIGTAYCAQDVSEEPSPNEDINKAFEHCKFGRFHIRLLITTFSGCIASILVTNSTSYLLPIAECDLNMNLKEKGLLQAMPFIGMYISSVIFGFLTDTFGRIRFLMIGYGGLFICSVLGALSQNYVMFASGKFGEGFFFGVLNGSLFSITAEFCHPTVRDRVMLCQASFSAIAQIICPGLAWAILTQDWVVSLFNGAMVLKSWNFFLLILSSWALVSFILFTTLPESPKFLATRKKYHAARTILIEIYTENTGKSAETCPYSNLWDKQIKEQCTMKENKIEVTVLKEFRNQMVIGLKNMKPMLQRPLMTYLIIMTLMNLVVILVYCVLKMWFPQLSTIVEHYKLDEDHNLCDSLDSYSVDEKIRLSHVTLNTTTVCVPTISGTETYVNSIIIGLVCLIPFSISGIIVNRFGKKSLFLFSGAICIGSLIGIRWANSNILMVSLFSITVAVTQFMKSLCQVVIVEIFPTAMRTLALSLIGSFALIGILAGNIFFPILLDFGCQIPFYVLTGTMIVFVGLSLITPQKTES